MGGGEDVSGADEGAAAAELGLVAASHPVTEVSQPGVGAQVHCLPPNYAGTGIFKRPPTYRLVSKFGVAWVRCVPRIICQSTKTRIESTGL